jgi:hypothetical protein
MKFYRVTHRTEGGRSNGYSWHTRKVAARRQVAEINRDIDEYYAVGADLRRLDHSTIDEPIISIDPTKSGILAALNYYASHPDNG